MRYSMQSGRIDESIGGLVMVEKVGFEAAVISLTVDTSVRIAAFADSERDPQQFLVLQRAVSPTNEDQELGLDGLHLELGGQQQSAYGAVDGFKLSDQCLAIGLTEAAARRFGVDREVRVTLKVSEAEIDRIAAFLAQMLPLDR